MSRKYSLYIPAYNAEKTIAQCLSSVMLQEYPFDEVIVIDDGSEDKTAELAKSAGAEVITLGKNKGLAAARNAGVSACRNDLVASIDADVILDFKWLFEIDKYFNAERFAGISGKLTEPAKDVYAGWRSANMKQHWGETARFVPFMYGAVSVFAKAAIIDAGGYDIKYKTNYEDYDLCKKITQNGRKLFYVPYAKSEHIKEDNLQSLLNSFWKWQFYYYSEKNIYIDIESLNFKLKENIGLANRLLRKSVANGENEYLYIDFILGIFLIVKDIFHTVGNTAEYSLATDSWLLVLDAVMYLKGLPPKHDFSLLDKKYTEAIYFIRVLLLLLYLLDKELMVSKDFKQKFIADICGIIWGEQLSKEASKMLIAFSETVTDISPFFESESKFLNSKVYGQQNFIFELKTCYNAWKQDIGDIAVKLKESQQT